MLLSHILSSAFEANYSPERFDSSEGTIIVR
jgi:hypothetical protein